MTSLPGPKQRSVLRRGILQVDVAPVGENQSQRGRFGRFLDWLRDVFRIEDSQRATDEVRDLVDQAREAAQATLQLPSIRNAHLEAEISQQLAKTEQLRIDVEMDARLFNDRQAFQRAQTAKVRAETAAIEAETKIKTLEAIQRLGFDVTPIIRDGQLDGLYVTKAPPQRYIRAVERGKKSGKNSKR